MTSTEINEMKMPRHMTWPEIASEYPDRWVALKNVKMDGANIAECDVAAVITDDEICDYANAHLQDGLMFKRTSDVPSANGH